MNTRVTLLVCCLAWAPFGCRGGEGASNIPASSNTKVATLELQENQVVCVPTHPNVTVFIQFPGPITDFAGRGFSEDPAEVAGDFFVRHVDGDSYLAVTPLTDTARRTLHVISGGHGYPLHFFPATEDAAWDKLILVEAIRTDSRQVRLAREGGKRPAASALPTGSDGVTRSSHPPRANAKHLGVERTLGVIDTLRMLANLPPAKALAVVQCNRALALSLASKVQDFGEYKITTHFVLRDNVYDALGFSLSIENVSRNELHFEPNSFTVRAGDHVYAATASDWSPLVPPKEKVPVFFVVAGDGSGGLNRLSCDNDFRVSLAVAARTNPHPTSTLAVPAPGEKEAVQ